MVEEKVLADLLFGLGTSIGLVTKFYQLIDEGTVISRRSTLPNVLSWPFTAMLPLYLFQAYFSLTVATFRYLITVGLYLYRSPEKEDFLGRDDKTYSELFSEKSFLSNVCLS